jgi:uncharacterized protein
MYRTMTLAAAAAVAGAVFAAHAAAQQPAVLPAGTPTIRVSATGEARAAPDQVTLDFGVETQAPTAQAAAAENARRMERVIQALTRAGVPRTRIQTRNYMVMPEYAHDRDGTEPRITGYRVGNTVTVTVDGVERTGELIDAALAAGGNRVAGVRFGFREPEQMRALAIQDAIRRGRAEAEAIAAGLGVSLGPVIDASTSAPLHTPPPFPMMEARMAMDAGPTPVEPGEQLLTAAVHLVYAIR